MVKIALAQFGCKDDKETNLRKIIDIICEAAANGSQIVCLPELSSTIYFCDKVDATYFDLAESIPGPSTKRIAEIAKKLGIVVIFPMFEKVIEGEYYNSAAVIGTKGELLGRYRKTMIPCLGTPGTDHNEKFYFRPGNIPYPVFETPFGIKFGILICFDRHFTEPFRCLALQGAELVFVSAATGKLRSLWELELKAHASFNIIYVAGTNKVGTETIDQKFPCYGSSMLVNPKAEVLCKGGEKEEIVYGEIDVEFVHSERIRLGFYRDRRPDLYSIISDKMRIF